MTSRRLPSRLERLRPDTPWRAAAWYAAVTLAMTWPVAAGLTRDLAPDLGDSLLNCWILAWDAEHLLRALGGDPGALGELWHGNIFHPSRYALAYSELLVAQAVQILPVYAITRNPILCYNLLFLSTFVLSALGMYLLAREVTGDWRAGFVSGLLYGFLLYRVDQLPHLQVLSSQWMPFALYGLHRYLDARRPWALAGGSLALVAQNLSCGYFLLFFSLFVPPWVAHEMARRGLWREWRVWAALAAAGVGVAALTLPFMRPYLALREIEGTRRSLEEVLRFSPDAWGWLTAPAGVRVWGTTARLRPRPEGDLFPGATILVLAAIAASLGTRRAWRAVGSLAARVRPPRWRQAALVAGLAGLIASLLASGIIAAGFGGRIGLPGVEVRVVSLSTALARVGLCLALVLAASARARALAGRAWRSPLAFALGAAGVAAYLALGPNPTAGGRPMHGPPIYLWLYEHVPGFDGLRVPGRFAMVSLCFLALAAAWGARDLLARAGRWKGLLAAGISALWLLEGAAAPLPVNETMAPETPGLRSPPSRVAPPDRAPAIYRSVDEQLPADAVLAEFPFGDVSWEIRYVFYSTSHWRRLINGFSGYAPRGYLGLAEQLRDSARLDEEGWTALLASGATHAIVHGQAYADERLRPDGWLLAHGARLLVERGDSRIYALPRPGRRGAEPVAGHRDGCGASAAGQPHPIPPWSRRPGSDIPGACTRGTT